MIMEDSDSDKCQRSRHSHRDSPPSNLDKPGHRRQHSERNSTKRLRSKRSRERVSEERRKRTPSQRTKLQHDNIQDSQKSSCGDAAEKNEFTRHHKKKSRSRDANYDQYIETPVTRVLQEVPDDISDTPHPCFYGTQQNDGDSEHYRIQKGKDCVYVEHYDGFSSVPRHNALTDHIENLDRRWFDLSSATALDVAITVQKIWIALANFCHGLLAGIALMQVILVDRLLGFSPEEADQFITFYSKFSLIFTTTFFLLASVCLVSIFDRLDLARGDWPYLMDLLSVRPRIPWLLIPIYVSGLLLALSTAKGDDWIHMSQYSSSNFTILKADLDMLSSWHVLNSLRCACVVIGWLLISASHPPDLLLNLLADMLPLQTDNCKQKGKAMQSTSH